MSGINPYWLACGVGGRALYRELRADGWPLCPSCGEDELFSNATPATARSIVGCYLCGWSPGRVPSHELRPVDFLTWLGPRWREWARENGKPEHGHRSDEDHESFERWLCERGPA